MNKTENALKLALEAFEDAKKNHGLVYVTEMCALREALEQPAQQQEPFGYFKPEPFGWTDCAETDEGAIALYERPQPAQQQEPVAWKDRTYGNLHHQDFGNSIPLYTSPQSKPLPKGEWPKHPSAYVNDEYIGYSTSDLDNYATQVLAAHGITGE